MNSARGRGRGRTFYRSPRNNQQPSSNPTPRSPPTTDYVLNRTSSLDHDNNCCQGISLVLELNQHGLLFLDELKRMWNMLKKSPPVVNMIQHYFSGCDNPYSQTLKLIYNCQEFNNAKNKSLPCFIIEEFRRWTLLYRNQAIHMLGPQLKIDAFQVVNKQSALNLTKIVMEVYELPNDRELFIEIIKCMINKKQYKEACQNVVLLNLQDQFTVEDFALPMVLQDKFGIEDFLKSSPKHQVDLITILDSALGKPSVRDALAAHALTLKVPSVKWENLRSKPLKKLIARFVKMFKLPQDLTPNLNKKRNEGALQFLIHKRFIENSFGDESWKEMVQEAVGDDEELHKELVAQVCVLGDVAEALNWARFYKIDKKDWPYNVRMLDENPDQQALQQRNIIQDEEAWDNDLVQNSGPVVVYHKFPLPFSAIHLIDSESGFEKFLDTALGGVDIVGIDCEWKPNFGGQENELALMQVATRNSVFILDTIKLGTKTPHLWQELGKFLFDNCDILKLGFSFANDVTMIKSSLPDLNFTPKQLGFLDLLSLWKIIEKQPKVVLPYEVQGSGPSLSSLVNQCLGRPLDKSDQFSNWENRPLRESQLLYAAIDAYCLIQVYDVLKDCCEKADFSFDETCYNLMTNEKLPKKPKPKKTNKKAHLSKPMDEIIQPPSPHPESVPVTSMKVVCDTMLQGLGKNLRRCGVDTAILENHMDHMECVRYAQDEQRYILTRGKTVFNKLMGYVPMGHCLKIISDNVDEQLKEFLDYYKVQITKDDVFSICQACNGNSYVKISNSTMVALRQSNAPRNYIPPEYADVHEATGFTSEEDSDGDAGPSFCTPTPRKWNPHLDEKVDVARCLTKKGATIQVDSIPNGILEKFEVFYVCEECGKVYYDGSHFERVVTGRLRDIVQ